MRIKPLLLTLPLGSILAGSVLIAPALAEDTATVASTQPPAAQVTPLTIRQVYDKVEAAGFSDIIEIERESDVFEVKAIDPQGKKAKLKVDLVTGEILKTESKAKKEKKDEAGVKKDKEKEKKQAKDDQQEVAPATGEDTKDTKVSDEAKEGDDDKGDAPKDQPMQTEPQPAATDAPNTKAESKP